MKPRNIQAVFKEENAKFFWPVGLDGKKMLRKAPVYLNQIMQILSDSLAVAVLEKEVLFSVEVFTSTAVL